VKRNYNIIEGAIPHKHNVMLHLAARVSGKPIDISRPRPQSQGHKGGLFFCEWWDIKWQKDGCVQATI